MKTIVSLFSILILGCLFLGCGATPEEKADRAVKYMNSSWSLTSEQKIKLEQLKKEALADYQESRQERLKIMDEVALQIPKEKTDTEVLIKMAKARQEKSIVLQEKWIKKVAEFHAGLDAKQKLEVAEDFKKFREHLEK